MNYKMKLLLALLTLSSTVNGAFAYGQSYMGGSIGNGWLSGSGKAHGYAGMINIFGGYGATQDVQQKIYLGGELNAHVDYAGPYSNSYGLGAFFIPGINVSDSTMIYTKLGLDTIYLSRYYTLSTSAQIGLGLQTALSQKMDMRIEFVTGVASVTNTLNIGLVYKFD